MNPEFRRNLWLQLSWPRLVLTPVLLGAIFALVGGAGANAPFLNVTKVAWWGFWAAAVLWGARRAADALAEEVNGGTWHGQRMSSLGAWPMTWGKLFGATAFPWYVALICLAVHQATWTLEGSGLCGPVPPSASQVGVPSREECLAGYVRFWWTPVWMVMIAVAVQATAFACCLATQRRRPFTLRLPVLACQTLAISATAGVLQVFIIFDPLPGRIWEALDGYRSVKEASLQWYGRSVDPFTIYQVTLALFLGLSLLAAYRLMRCALQYRTWPWGLLFGLILVLVLIAGADSGVALRNMPGTFTASSLGLFSIAAGATYIALFAERMDFPRLSRLGQAARRADLPTALRLCPNWVAAYAFALCFGIAAAFWPGEASIWHLRSMPSTPLPGGGESVPAVVAARLLYLARDILLVLWFHLAVNTRRADLGAILTLGVLHLLVPIVAMTAGWERVVAQLSGGGPIGIVIAVGLPAVQVLAAGYLLALRWRGRRAA